MHTTIFDSLNEIVCAKICMYLTQPCRKKGRKFQSPLNDNLYERLHFFTNFQKRKTRLYS